MAASIALGCGGKAPPASCAGGQDATNDGTHEAAPPGQKNRWFGPHGDRFGAGRRSTVSRASAGLMQDRMSELREERFKTTSVWADQPMLDIELNSGLHDDWRIVTVFFQPDFKDALGNDHRASYVTVWERKDAWKITPTRPTPS